MATQMAEFEVESELMMKEMYDKNNSPAQIGPTKKPKLKKR